MTRLFPTTNCMSKRGREGQTTWGKEAREREEEEKEEEKERKRCACAPCCCGLPIGRTLSSFHEVLACLRVHAQCLFIVLIAVMLNGILGHFNASLGNVAGHGWLTTKREATTTTRRKNGIDVGGGYCAACWWCEPKTQNKKKTKNKKRRRGGGKWTSKPKPKQKQATTVMSQACTTRQGVSWCGWRREWGRESEGEWRTRPKAKRRVFGVFLLLRFDLWVITTLLLAGSQGFATWCTTRTEGAVKQRVGGSCAVKSTNLLGQHHKV